MYKIIYTERGEKSRGDMEEFRFPWWYQIYGLHVS
jgi:hypothetical protein